MDRSVSGVSTHFGPLTRLLEQNPFSDGILGWSLEHQELLLFTFFNCYCYSSCGLLFFQPLELLELRHEAFGEGFDLNNAALDLDLN